jgi:glycerol kinase
MSEAYILGIDQGTSATKAILFSADGALVHRCDAPHAQSYPRPGWVEHDPVELYEKTLEAVGELLRATRVRSSDIKAVSISNQRETALVWDRRTGVPIHNAIVWQCCRAAEICERIAAEGLADLVKDRTGLVLSPYFSAAKIKWLLDNVAGARDRMGRGELFCGTVDSWLIGRLTGGEVHATDYSNASRTQLLNLRSLDWDDELLRAFGVSRSMLPKIRFSDSIFGMTDLGGLLDRKVPIAGVMGDSHAALFGQCCFERGMAKATYGTGSSIMMNIGRSPIESRGGLVTSIAWGMAGEIEYVFEGNINCAGATIKWLVDDIELIPDSKSAGGIAASVPDNGGVYLVPAFVGLSAPYWDSEARASITGMSRGTKKAHIVRAAMESIAYQIKDILDLMVRESGTEIRELRVDGGPTRDDFLMQFQADMLAIPVECAAIEELSAIGAAYMGGLAVGLWKDKGEIESLREGGRTFKPLTSEAEREGRYRGWIEAVERTLARKR